MINPVAFSIFGHDIRWYGIIIAIGLLLGILLAMHHAKREGQNPDSVLDLALIVVPIAVIFARIYYVVFQWGAVYGPPYGVPDAYGQVRSFWDVFAIWKGGLAIYGAVIGGLLGAWIYVKFVNKKIKLLPLLDILAPSLILGQAIGRWGNFVNQEAFGNAVANPSWQWFPAAVYITNPQTLPAGQQPGWFMATFFYESMWNFIIFAFLYFYFKNSKSRKTGNVFWFYLLLYGFGRLIIEGLRTDSLMLGDMRISQWLSGLLVIASACILLMPFVKMQIALRREQSESTTLDESLRLRVDIPQDEEAAPAESASAEDKPSETVDEDKAAPRDETDNKDQTDVTDGKENKQEA